MKSRKYSLHVCHGRFLGRIVDGRVQLPDRSLRWGGWEHSHDFYSPDMSEKFSLYWHETEDEPPEGYYWLPANMLLGRHGVSGVEAVLACMHEWRVGGLLAWLDEHGMSEDEIINMLFKYPGPPTLASRLHKRRTEGEAGKIKSSQESELVAQKASLAMEVSDALAVVISSHERWAEQAKDLHFPLNALSAIHSLRHLAWDLALPTAQLRKFAKELRGEGELDPPEN